MYHRGGVCHVDAETSAIRGTDQGLVYLIGRVCLVRIYIRAAISKRLFYEDPVPVFVRQQDARRRMRVRGGTEREQVLRTVIRVSERLT